MVIVVALATSAPPAAASDAPSCADSGHALRTARSSTTLVARSSAITSATAALAGTSTKLHSAMPWPYAKFIEPISISHSSSMIETMSAIDGVMRTIRAILPSQLCTIR